MPTLDHILRREALRRAPPSPEMQRAIDETVAEIGRAFAGACPATARPRGAMRAAQTYTAAELAALAWLAERPSGTVAAFNVPEEHSRAFVMLGRRTGRDKPLNLGLALRSARSYTLRDPGRAALSTTPPPAGTEEGAR